MNFALRAKLRQVLLSARILVGLVRAPAAPPTPVIQHAPPPTQDPLSAALTVNINDVIAQGLEPVRVPLMSDEDFQAGLEQYKFKEGKYPDDVERPTIEQASAFHWWIHKKRRIHLDYAILVPHGDRALMRRHFSARCLTVSNTLETMEVYGPPNYPEWKACHGVFTTLCIGWNVMSGGWCRSYDRKIEHFMNLYPEAWGLIYQADVRTRNELAPKLRTEMQYKYAKGSGERDRPPE